MPEVWHHCAVRGKAMVRLLVVLPPPFLHGNEENFSVAQYALRMRPSISIVGMEPRVVQWDQVVTEVVGFLDDAIVVFQCVCHDLCRASKDCTVQVQSRHNRLAMPLLHLQPRDGNCLVVSSAECIADVGDRSRFFLPKP